jgi:hypothetical protein
MLKVWDGKLTRAGKSEAIRRLLNDQGVMAWTVQMVINGGLLYTWL